MGSNSSINIPVNNGLNQSRPEDYTDEIPQSLEESDTSCARTCDSHSDQGEIDAVQQIQFIDVSSELLEDTGQNNHLQTNFKEYTDEDTDKIKEVIGSSSHIKEEKSLTANVKESLKRTFYIGGCNGVALIEDICTNLGWQRTKDRKCATFRFKWVEETRHINYNTFKEGLQMINHIPNNHVLTNKLGLLQSLKKYERICAATHTRRLQLNFIPETYCLDNGKDRHDFRNAWKEGTRWICKPTGTNQGRGIFLVQDMSDIDQLFEEQNKTKMFQPLNRIVQRYLGKPLLLNRKKFDIRCYMLVASTVPYLVLYHKGYLRLCIVDYDENSDNKIAHLTNQFIQRKDPSYKEVKDETIWSMEHFNDYVNKHYTDVKGIEKDWVLKTLPVRMKEIMLHCFQSVKATLKRKVGYHDLYGFDFLIDDDMKVWLIEINVNPCLAINCSALKAVIPGVVKETIHVANECFEKTRKKQSLLQLQTLRRFEVIFREREQQPSDSKPKRTASTSQKQLTADRNTSSPKNSSAGQLKLSQRNSRIRPA